MTMIILDLRWYTAAQYVLHEGGARGVVTTCTEALLTQQIIGLQLGGARNMQDPVTRAGKFFASTKSDYTSPATH